MNKFIKVKINFLWQGIYQVVTLIMGLIVPYVVLSTYGSEVNGLTSTIKQIILLSSLASAGITTAATYSLYKPIQEKDTDKIADIIKSVQHAYGIISLISLVVCILSSFILAVFQKGNMSSFFVLIACLLTSFNTLIDLYFTATTSVLLTAIQDKYLISIGMLITTLIMYCGQILICVINLHFIFLYTTSVVGTICKVIFLRYYYNKKKQELGIDKTSGLGGHKFIFRNVGYAFANEVAHTVNVASQSVIITVLYGLAESSVLSVYMMVVNSLSLIAQVVYSSFGPSFGAVVAENNIKKTNDVFEIFQYTMIALNTFLYMCAIPLFIPFVEIYTENVQDIQYVSKILVVESILYGVFYAARVPYNIVVSATGKFKKSAIQTSITCVVTLGIAVVCTIFDYRLVLCGSIVFYATNTFYQHFMLKKEVEGFNNNHFIRHISVTFICLIIMYCVSYFITSKIPIKGILNWSVMAICIAIFSVLLLGVVSYVIDKNSMRKVIKYFKMKLLKSGKRLK
ncbi:MAG: hypothetical protein K6B64_06260 [Acholeplasmatales bacterium]|nr:hypothetical protein [Acholeplasmatales bacterium]